jgi:ketosteroid isomerase-like protein
MSRVIAYVALAFFSVAPALRLMAEPAPATKNPVETMLMERERAWAQSSVDRDIALFRSLMADDYVELIQQPATATQKSRWESATKDSWTELLRSGHEHYDFVKLFNLKVYLQGDVATVTGQYSQKGTKNGADNSYEGSYVNTWVKRRGVWLLINSMFPLN